MGLIEIVMTCYGGKSKFADVSNPKHSSSTQRMKISIYIYYKELLSQGIKMC